MFSPSLITHVVWFALLCSLTDSRPRAERYANRLNDRHRAVDTSCTLSSNFNDAERAQIVTIHNQLRALEPASDMFQLKWSDDIAAKAQQLANTCIFHHGMTYDCDGVWIGQCLFQTVWMMNDASFGFPPVSLDTVINRIWYTSERKYWDFATWRCNASDSAPCGHWVQVVNARTTEVGCGYANCILPNDLTPMQFTVCDYRQSLSVSFSGAMKQYTRGQACSECWKITRQDKKRPGFKCVDKLCVQCSPTSDFNCQCPPSESCGQHGTMSPVDCLCHCQDGYYGIGCENSCSNKAGVTCSIYKNSGYCNASSMYYPWMKDNCAEACGLCL